MLSPPQSRSPTSRHQRHPHSAPSKSDRSQEQPARRAGAPRRTGSPPQAVAVACGWPRTPEQTARRRGRGRRAGPCGHARRSWACLAAAARNRPPGWQELPGPRYRMMMAMESMLTSEELERYARHIVLREVGGPGQRALRQARVLTIGAGGLGSPLLLYLAAAGVGTLGIVDDDVVALSNLQRQVLHATADVGRPKVETAADAILRLNPHVKVATHAVRLTAANALALIGDYDLVADGSDNFATRYLVSDA